MNLVFTHDAVDRIVQATRQVEDWQGTGTRRPSHRPRPTSSAATSAAIRMGIIVGFANPADRFVQVIEPTFNDSDPWDGGWVIPSDPPSLVWCQPPLHAEDYTDFVHKGGTELTDDDDWLDVVRYRGVWFIKQQPAYGYRPYPLGARYGDCWATGGMP